MLYLKITFITLQVILSFRYSLEHYLPLHFVEHTEQQLETTKTKEQGQLGY
jgi:hypothetical protein